MRDPIGMTAQWAYSLAAVGPTSLTPEDIWKATPPTMRAIWSATANTVLLEACRAIVDAKCTTAADSIAAIRKLMDVL